MTVALNALREFPLESLTVRASPAGMPLELPLKLSLGAATGVELFAGVSLVLAPERFVRKTYGGTAPVDALTVKYARCVA